MPGRSNRATLMRLPRPSQRRARSPVAAALPSPSPSAFHVRMQVLAAARAAPTQQMAGLASAAADPPSIAEDGAPEADSGDGGALLGPLDGRGGSTVEAGADVMPIENGSLQDRGGTATSGEAEAEASGLETIAEASTT